MKSAQSSAEAHETVIRIAILILVLVGLVVRMWGLDAQSIWRDEADSLLFAGDMAQVRHMFLSPGHNAPFYYLLLRGWTWLAGDNLLAARFLSTVWGILAIPVAFGIGRRVFGSAHGLGLACLCALSPYLIWYSQEARTYAPLLTTSLLAFRILTDALDRGGRIRWGAYILCFGTCLYLHITAILLLPVHVLAGLLLRSHDRLGYKGLSIIAALLLLSAIPLLSWGIPLLLSPFQTGHQATRPVEMAAGLLIAFTTGPSGKLGAWAALPGLFALLAGIASPLLPKSAQATPSKRTWVVMLAWLLLPPMLLAVVSSMMPLYSERYLIFIAPAFYLLAIMGVHHCGRLWRPAGVVLLAGLLLVNVAGIWLQTTEAIKPDFRSAGAFFQQHALPGDAVLFLIPHGERPFSYYVPASPDMEYVGAPFANHAREPADLEREIQEAIGDRRRIWLLESEEELWDRQGLVRAWLDQNRARELHQEYHLVSLTLYQHFTQ